MTPATGLPSRTPVRDPCRIGCGRPAPRRVRTRRHRCGLVRFDHAQTPPGRSRLRLTKSPYHQVGPAGQVPNPTATRAAGTRKGTIR